MIRNEPDLQLSSVQRKKLFRRTCRFTELGPRHKKRSRWYAGAFPQLIPNTGIHPHKQVKGLLGRLRHSPRLLPETFFTKYYTLSLTAAFLFFFAIKCQFTELQ